MTTHLKRELSIWRRRHAHGLVLGWRWRWTIWRTSRSRVVLRSAPGQTNTGVSDWVTLHLVDGHLSSMTLDELDETATFSWWDLDVGDFSKALEEGTQLILGNISGKTSNKDSCVVGIRELVHWLRSTVITDSSWGSTHAVHAWS